MGLKNWFSHLNTQIWAASLPREPDDLASEVPGPFLAPLFEFTAWPKTPRLMRDIVITEKLDGTNAAIQIRRVPTLELVDHLSQNDPTILGIEFASPTDTLVEEGEYWVIGAQSRNRVISLANDNQGFAKWVSANQTTLFEDLGEGLHFGEFWGNKIGRGYGLQVGDRRFSLFNPTALDTKIRTTAVQDSGVIGVQAEVQTPGLDVVPVLYEGPFEMFAVRQTLIDLQRNGSTAALGYPNPEGIVVYHTHARRIIGKVTLDNQDAGKWES
jgi:hypothetical protein